MWIFGVYIGMVKIWVGFMIIFGARKSFHLGMGRASLLRYATLRFADASHRHHQLDPSKPVWITEFAPTNWNEANPLPKEHVESFMKESIKYLDSLDWVERYAFFGAMRDCGTVGKHARMIDDGGKLTELGKAYRDG